MQSNIKRALGALILGMALALAGVAASGLTSQAQTHQVADPGHGGTGSGG